MTDQFMIPQDAPLAVTLTAQQWVVIQQVLGEGPHRVVGPLIGEIQRQCVAQIERDRRQSEATQLFPRQIATMGAADG